MRKINEYIEIYRQKLCLNSKGKQIKEKVTECISPHPVLVEEHRGQLKDQSIHDFLHYFITLGSTFPLLSKAITCPAFYFLFYFLQSALK